MTKPLSETRAALRQGLAILAVLVILFCSVYATIYWFGWASNPHWVEAFRDRFKLWNLADNRFWLWIHQDTQYWVVRVRFDRGPIVIEGPAPTARYWSVAYYPAKEYSLSLGTQSAILDDQGRYRITLGQDIEDSVDQQTIKVDPGLKRGIVELRVTLPNPREPLTLPSITQNGRVLVEGGRP